MKIKLTLFLLLSIVLGSCEKNFLDKKSDKALLIPRTLSEMQALLDNHQVMNRTPAIGYLSSDDFNITDAGYNAFGTPVERNAYIWAKEIQEGTALLDWNVPYQHIFYCNVALEGLADLTEGEKKEPGWNTAKGTALFLRAYAYFNLLQLFSGPYDAAKAGQLPGVPISASSKIRQSLVRNSQLEGYELVLKDLLEAVDLLPGNQQVKTRPDRAAALALLARTALTMKNYDQAAKYAASSLGLKSTLNDYSQYSTASLKPFPVVLPNNNDEVLFYAPLLNYSYLNSALTFVDPLLYQTYHADDLRKGLFFLNRGNNQFTFKGSYAGPINPGAAFSGLTINEVYLISAEAKVRTGKVLEGLQDLNKLLEKRWKKNTFKPFSAGTSAEALKIVLEERRKELVGRELRWQDLRRLNDDPAFQVTLRRQSNNKAYQLLPGSLRYTFSIPADEIEIYGWEQNDR
ncbi:RagB/SusD family nutrient uptake outer membrane protein [Daejeonella sp. JGW-45]|uniref:RagB/SusD family nutrient uptake outer membrane protein n=1 Tax=Daejeonella sp. JGW-45 TaxID=3034148 RepID=UPI0023EC73EE|nr:RagB/SusD family nutrient uptake outer membrane protein [Daejeonella sp. JGW-45]